MANLEGFEEVDRIPGEKEERSAREEQAQAGTWEEVDSLPGEEEERDPTGFERLNRAFDRANEEDPDRAARAYKAANETGKNPYEVTLDLDRAEKEARRPNFEKLAGEAPILTRANESAFFQNQAQNDQENLSWLERTAKIVGRSWQRGQRNVRLGHLRHEQQTEGHDPESKAAIKELKGQRKDPLEPSGFWQSAFQAASEMGPIMWEGIKEGTLGYGPAFAIAGGSSAMAAGPFSPIASPAATGLGYTIGSVYGSAKSIYEIESGLAYDEMLQENVDRETANYLAAGVGTLNALLETSQISDVARTIPGAKNAIRKGLQQAAVRVAKKGAGRELAQAAGRGSAFLARETAQELAQEVTQITGTEVGKALTEKDLPHATPEEITQQLLTVGEQSAKAFLVLGMPGATMQTAQIASTVRREQKTEQALERIAQVANKSGLYQRNPDLFKDFINDLRDNYGHVPRKLYLNAETVQQAYESDPELAETLKMDRDDLESKLADQEDIRIDFETAIDLYQRSDWEQFREGLRDTPFTPEDVDQGTMERIQQLFQETEELTAPAQEFERQLVETTQMDRGEFKKQYGVTPETYARDQAKVIDSFARVWAENTGRTPEQYWQYRGFDVQAEEGGQASSAYGNVDVSPSEDVEATYEISETGTGYGTDEAGTERASSSLRERKREKGRPKGQARLPLEYYTPDSPPSDQALQKIIKSGEVEQVSTGQFEVNVDTVTSPEDAAAVVQPLSSAAQEHAVAIVLDSEDRPVSIVKHSVGGESASQVYPQILAGAIHNTPGAQSVYLAHNHPSGRTIQSEGDYRLAKELQSLLEGTGVEFRGSVVMAPNGQASFYNPAALSEQIEATPQKRASLKRKIDVKERQFTQIPENPFEIRGPESLKNFFETYLQSQQGALLMNNNMSPVGFVPMTAQEMQQLRAGRTGEGASKLWQGIDRTNGTSIALNFGDQPNAEIAQALDNMLLWARDSQVRVVDALYSDGNSMRKEGVLQMRQDKLGGRDTFFQLDPRAEQEAGSEGMTQERGSGTYSANQPPQPESGEHWAFRQYVNETVPEGWYVHGRADKQDLDTGYVIQVTQDWDTADGYAGKDGSVWMLRPSDDATVLDFSSPEATDVQRVLDQFMQDFEEGELPPQLEDIADQVQSSDKQELAEDIAPERIAEAAGLFDEPRFNEWLYDRFEVDFIKTPDGGVFFDTENQVALKASDRPLDFDEKTEAAERLSFETARPPSEGGTLYEGQRGSVTFQESGRAIINLTKGQDLSTVLHEIGHVFRRDLEEMANLPGVPQRVRDDWQTILGWVGAEDGNWTREQEEKFARAWEQYFLEGTAPIPRIKRVFHRFRKWLLDIYQGAKRSFDLTDEVRAVFDRMLATRDELDHAAEQMMIDPVLEQDDMTLEEWQEYERLSAEAKREAMERATKERIGEWRNLQRQWRRQAEEMAEESQIVQIRREIIKAGGLSLETLRGDYDGDTIRMLNRKSPGIVSKNGILQPDLTAEQYGYDYDGLIVALLDTPTKAELEADYFKQLEAEHDRNFRPDEALLSDEQFQLLDKEIEILNRKLERFNPPASRSLAKHIRQQIKRGRYQDIEADLDTLLGTMHREGKEAKQAIREARQEGKRESWEKALEQKRRQRLHALKLREERKAKKRVDTIRRKLKRWLNQKNLDPEYKEQLQEFLAPFDLAQRSDKALRERQSLREFIEQHKDSGEQVLDIPPYLQELAARKHPKEISLNELEEIHDTAEHIVHLGRLKSKLIARQKAREFEAVKDELVETALSQHTVQEKPEGVPPPSAREQGMVDNFIEGGHGWLAELRKVEFILQSIDGTYSDQQTGPWWENIFRPIKDAEHAELQWLQEVTGKLDEIFKPIRDQGKEVFQKRYTIEGWPHPQTREEMIMIALNWGNEGNKDAVRWGYGLMDQNLYQQNPEAARLAADSTVNNLLNQLTETEWQFVSEVWDLIDSLYPRINEAHKALTGQSLEKVEPSPLDTPIGRLRGGYFPLVFDRELSYKADVYKTEQEAELLFETIYSRPKTESGHRVSRQGGKMTPLLSLNVIPNHIQKAIHDATHAVPVRDVYKLIKDPEIRQAIIDTQGKATYDQLMPWLQWVANPQRPKTGQMEKLLRRLRNNTTIALLGANVGTMMAQPMSITQAVDAVGLPNVARAFTSFWSNPWAVVGEVDEKSVQMRNRRKTWNREFADIFNQWIPQKGGAKRYMRKAQELAMFTISLGDYVGAYPSWLAAYKKAMQEGRSESDAIEYADRIVRTTQPASSPKDLPAIQRLDQGEAKKMVTMFYSFFNVFYNRMYNKHKGFLQDKVSADQLIRGYIWMVMVPPMLMQVFKHRGDLDEDYWRDTYLKDLANYAAGTLPIARDVINGLTTGFSYSLTPITEAIKTPLSLAREIISDEPEAGDIAKHTAESVGYAVGLPTPAAVDSVTGLADVMSGRTDDYLRPIYGKKREDWRED